MESNNNPNCSLEEAKKKTAQIPLATTTTSTLEICSNIIDSHQLLKRTGTIWTAVAHVITGVIGAGVLSLAWSTAQLGWLFGPLAILVFAAITQLSILLVCDCYRSPDPAFGPARNPSFIQAVNFYLGTIWTAVAHIITGVIGSGVLSLAWSMAQLGWIFGPFSMLFFAFVTLISTSLVCDCYRSPDPEFGPIRNRFYNDAVKLNLGDKSAWICRILMNINFYGTGIAYVITSATCLRAIQRSNCYHKNGHDAPCEFGDTFYMLIFGVVQIFMSQIPDFHSMEWLSVVAAIMSFAYSFIGLGLGAAKVVGDGAIKGSINGLSTSEGIQKVWLISQAIGDVAFAYPFSIIVLNIQDTLQSPPPENETMKRASMISICITTFLYLSCGGFGYAAFGDQTPGNLLTGFGFYEPYWLIDFANACIVLHLVGGYQMYSQPVFAAIDNWFSDRTSSRMNIKRVCFRTGYVVSTTAVAMIFPYFNQVLGVLGAVNFWPLAIYFPVEMGLRQKKIGAWKKEWIILRSFSIVCFILTMFALVGSIQGLFAAKFS